METTVHQNPSRRVVVFVCLAKMEAVFYGKISQTTATREGSQFAFISFHDGGTAWLRERGFLVFSPYDYLPAASETSSPQSEVDLQFFATHEQKNFWVRERKDLVIKLQRYIVATRRIIDELQTKFPELTPVLVQEFGGYSPTISSYLNAKTLSLNHVFIETAFIKQRVFFTLNSFESPNVPFLRKTTASPQMIDYIASLQRDKPVVIPAKDERFHFNPVKKLTRIQNWKRFLQKLNEKYVLRHREPFSYVEIYTLRHILMLWNHIRIRSNYAHSITKEPFVYFPMHVPNDVALTLRSPAFYDQMALIDYLARTLPDGWQLLIKEHPAAIGEFNYKKLKKILTSNNNVRLLSPRINSYAIAQKATCTVAINSKAGLESALIGCPTFVLGDAFYKTCPFVKKVENVQTLPTLIRELPLGTARNNAFSGERELYLENIYDASWPGDLYDNDESNVRDFASSLSTYLESLQMTREGQD